MVGRGLVKRSAIEAIDGKRAIGWMVIDRIINWNIQ